MNLWLLIKYFTAAYRTICKLCGIGYLIDANATPWGPANSGTIATNGTVTLGTALSSIYSNGIWLYFPAGAVSAGAAGWYWAVMSSTTVGIVYTSQTSGIPVTGSNSPYTGVTSAITGPSINVPGLAMGINGTLRFSSSYSCNNTAGSKAVVATFGGSSSISISMTTAVGGAINGLIQNKGSYSSQRYSNLTTTASTGIGGFLSIDTMVNQILAYRFQNAVATDVLIQENYFVELFPRG